jgi:hypothetical protein
MDFDHSKMPSSKSFKSVVVTRYRKVVGRDLEKGGRREAFVLSNLNSLFMIVRRFLLTLAILAISPVLTGCEYFANVVTDTTGTIFGMPPTRAGETAIEMQIVVHIITTHKATERQRQIAEERVRLAYQHMSPELKTKVDRHRYIAVSTVRERNSQGARSLMLWGTQVGIGSVVYDIEEIPKEGAILKISNHVSVYLDPGK